MTHSRKNCKDYKYFPRRENPGNNINFFYFENWAYGCSEKIYNGMFLSNGMSKKEKYNKCSFSRDSPGKVKHFCLFQELD
jgi:hypothetical protein